MLSVLRLSELGGAVALFIFLICIFVMFVDECEQHYSTCSNLSQRKI